MVSSSIYQEMFVYLQVGQDAIIVDHVEKYVQFLS